MEIQKRDLEKELQDFIIRKITKYSNNNKYEGLFLDNHVYNQTSLISSTFQQKITYLNYFRSRYDSANDYTVYIDHQINEYFEEAKKDVLTTLEFYLKFYTLCNNTKQGQFLATNEKSELAKILDNLMRNEKTANIFVTSANKNQIMKELAKNEALSNYLRDNIFNAKHSIQERKVVFTLIKTLLNIDTISIFKKNIDIKTLFELEPDGYKLKSRINTLFVGILEDIANKTKKETIQIIKNSVQLNSKEEENLTISLDSINISGYLNQMHVEKVRIGLKEYFLENKIIIKNDTTTLNAIDRHRISKSIYQGKYKKVADSFMAKKESVKLSENYLQIINKHEDRKTKEDNIRIERFMHLYQNSTLKDVKGILHNVSDTVNNRIVSKIMEIKFSSDISVVFSVSSAYLINFKNDSIFAIYQSNKSDSLIQQITNTTTKAKIQKVLAPILDKYKIEKSYTSKLLQLLEFAYDKRKRIE